MSRGLVELENAAKHAGKAQGRFIQSWHALSPTFGVWWFPLNDLGTLPDTTRGIYLGNTCTEAKQHLDQLPDAEPAQPKAAPVVPISAPKGRRRNKEASDG